MRLTKKVEDKAVFHVCEKPCLACNGTSCGFNQAIVDRLAAYEDAEEQGLLVRLPCKVGSTVYRIITRRLYCVGEKDIVDVEFTLDMLDDFGKTVFLTREEAEAALIRLKGETNTE